VLNLIATDLQLYTIFKIMRVSFLGHSVPAVQTSRSSSQQHNDVII